METLKKIFTPFSELKKSATIGIFLFQLTMLLLTWAIIPGNSFFPNLKQVLGAWVDLWNNGLFYHILATLKLCGIATIIGIIFSCIISYISTIPFFTPISLFLTKLRFNPIQGFTLFLAIMTSGGRNLQITLLVIFMSFYFINSLVAIIKSIPEEDLIRCKTQKMNNWKVLWNVVILDRLDYLVEVIRQNLSMMFMMIVSVEAMDKTQGGLGALIIDTNRALNFPKIFALQLTILIIGISLDFILKKIFNSFPANQKN